MLGDALKWGGAVFQLLGLAAAGLGVYATRREYAPEQLGIGGSLLRAVGSLWQISSQLIQATLGRPSEPRTDHLQLADDLGIAESEYVEPRYHELPSDLGVEARLAELDQRTRDLRALANQFAAGLRAEEIERSRATQALSDALTQQDAAMDADIKHAMTDDLALQAWGLLLAALGTIISAFG